jgi:twitching motility protein PilT
MFGLSEGGEMTFLDYLKILVERKGSDLHLTAGLHAAIRVNGTLVPLEEHERLNPQLAKDLIFSILTEEQIRSFESDPQNRMELDFGYGVQGLGRFRCNVHRQRGTVAAVVRSLASKSRTFLSSGCRNPSRFSSKREKAWSW